MVAAPKNFYYTSTRFNFEGTLDEVLTCLEQHGCGFGELNSSVRGARIKEFSPPPTIPPFAM
jgi:hypothetical protein